MCEEIKNLDAAKIGDMYVTNVTFQWVPGGTSWDQDTRKNIKYDGHWSISATLKDEPSQYHGHGEQTMQFKVEEGVGKKLAEVLVPVIMTDAARKAEALAAKSKAMLEALGNRTMACLTQGANNDVKES